MTEPNAACRTGPQCYRADMGQEASAGDRIDAALARIEIAVMRRDAEATALAQRHATLRERMSEAVAALDAVIAGGERD